MNTSKANVPTEALGLIAEHVKPMTDPSENPTAFICDVHKRWRSGGGKVEGKPRHSDRYLDDRLKEAGSPVRSLTPKLNGRTRMKPKEGAVLIHFFLSQWPEGDDELVSYKALLPQTDIQAVSKYVATLLDTRAREAALRSSNVAPQATDSETDRLPGEPIPDAIERHFRECDALITVSPEQVLHSAGPGTAFVGFRDLMDALHGVETRDHKYRPLIWVLDIGTLNMDDLSARKKFMNVQNLMIWFKALKRFDDRKAKERWNWLLERAVIVLLDSYYGGEEEAQSAKRPEFQSHHISLSNINPDWAVSPNFRALYGSNFERIDTRSFSVFYKKSGKWSFRPEENVDLIYYGYGSFRQEKTKEDYGRGLELPRLPGRYADAARATCAAAAQVLDLPPFSKDPADAGDVAIQQLGFLGYRVLRLDEFLEDY